MDKRWFCSDLHIGHSLMNETRGFGQRFDDTWKHDNQIAQKWDAKVGPGDTVYVLGDVAMNRDKGLSFIAHRPGKKILIAGNHDTCHPHHKRWTRDLKKFMEVFEAVSIADKIKIGTAEIMLSHFPYDADREQYENSRFAEWRLRDTGKVLLHGHTHSTNKTTSRRELHVGWDAWRDVVSEEEIRWLMQSQGLSF